MGQPKLELPFRQSSILEASLAAISAANFFEKILVVQKKEIAPPGFRVREIGNEAEIGMHRSIRRGLEALSPCAGVCIALADQPFLSTADYNSLTNAWQTAIDQGKSLLFPDKAGERGNPAIFSSRYISEVLAEPDTDRGCQYLFRRHPDQVYAWPASSDNFFKDIDYPEAYEQWKNS